MGDELLGRVLDGLGQPIDGGPALKTRHHYPVFAEAPNPMTRKIISRPLTLGLRALDGMLTCGEGQRMGIFAAAGGGKSTLLSSIIKGCSAEVCVLASSANEAAKYGNSSKTILEKKVGKKPCSWYRPPTVPPWKD